MKYIVPQYPIVYRMCRWIVLQIGRGKCSLFVRKIGVDLIAGLYNHVFPPSMYPIGAEAALSEAQDSNKLKAM